MTDDTTDTTPQNSIMTQQKSLLGETDRTPATIKTSGRTIRPIMSLATAVGEKSRFHLNTDELHTQYVDAAYVAMCALNVYPEAFETYDVPEEKTVGVNLSGLASELSWARMSTRTNDDVTLSISDDRTLATVTRDYDSTTLTQTDEVQNIDPDSIRDDPQIPDLSRPWKASIDVRALYDAIDHMDQYDAIAVMEHDGQLVMRSISGSDDEERYGQSVANFGEVRETAGEPVEDAKSLLSRDYLTDIVTGLKKGKVDDLTLYWGDEFPVRFEFARYADNDEETVAYDGHFMIAPRIQSEGPQ